MRYLILPLLFLLTACSTSEEAVTAMENESQPPALPTMVFGYQGGWGSESYVRYRDGKLYRNAYAGLRTNDPENKLNRDALATDETNWTLVGPAPADVISAVRELPLTALVNVENQIDCPDLASDGGCPYLGVVRNGEGGGYLEWHGSFPDHPAAAQYMQRVGDLIGEYAQ